MPKSAGIEIFHSTGQTKTVLITMVKSKNFNFFLQLCYNAILNVGWHCSTIVNQNIDILFIFHFLLSLTLYFNPFLSLSHQSLSSPFFFFSSGSLIQSLPLSLSSLSVWIDAHRSGGAMARVQWCRQVLQRCGQVVAVVWADGCDDVGLVELMV